MKMLPVREGLTASVVELEDLFARLDRTPTPCEVKEALENDYELGDVDLLEAVEDTAGNYLPPVHDVGGMIGTWYTMPDADKNVIFTEFGREPEAVVFDLEAAQLDIYLWFKEVLLELLMEYSSSCKEAT